MLRQLWMVRPTWFKKQCTIFLVCTGKGGTAKKATVGLGCTDGITVTAAPPQPGASGMWYVIERQKCRGSVCYDAERDMITLLRR